MGFFSSLFSRFFTSKEEKKRLHMLEQLQHQYDVYDVKRKNLNSIIAKLNQNKLEIWENAKKSAIEGQKVNVLLYLQHYRSLEVQIYKAEKQICLVEKFKAAISKLQQNEDLDTDAVYLDLVEELRETSENDTYSTCYLVRREPDTEPYDGIVPSVDSLYQKLMEAIAQEQGDSGTDEDASDKTGFSSNEAEAKPL